MFVVERFRLSDKTKEIIRNMEVRFGYNGFGEIVYYRTYSRLKPDGKQEQWYDTVTRVIEGVFSIRKDWYIRNHIEWDEDRWQDYARRMAVSMCKMHWLPPGRGLWAMGTDYVYERGAMALYNCASTNISNYSLCEDICWGMDCLMNGVGVGYNIINEEPMIDVHRPKGIETYTIPDTREGWVESVRKKINSYLIKGSKCMKFDYSQIRPAGAPIRGFGGICSGYEPLAMFHKQIDEFFMNYLEFVNYDLTQLKADLANATGCCVVAGNVRRSAEILVGGMEDETFLDLKDYTIFPYRESIGWMSNNSIRLKEDSDFEHMSEIAERIVHRGEPGFINLRNFPYPRVGKIKDYKKYPKDEADSCNPCITGDTLIALADGRGFVPIKELEGTDCDVYAIDEKNEIVIRRMRHVRKTGYNVKILKVTFDTGDVLRCTENHKIMLRDGTFVEARNLRHGDSVSIFNRYVPNQIKESYFDQYISVGFKSKMIPEHKLIAQNKFQFVFDDEHVHHVDGNKFNNDPDNLELKECYEHLSEHSEGSLNPNYSGYSMQALVDIGIALCLKLGRRFSYEEWLQHGPISSFSQWRRSYLGTMYDFSVMCAELAGLNNQHFDTRTLKRYQRMVDLGYETRIDSDGTVEVLKICEGCNLEFWINANRREQASCSGTCNNIIRDYTKNAEGQRKYFEQAKLYKREQQLQVYHDLKQKLGRHPKQKEWFEECSRLGVPYRLCANGSGFSNFKQLQYRYEKWDKRSNNHKVVAVIEDGYEDVYNGTVDELHNFISGGWVEILPSGRQVTRGIVNQQCGEIVLCNKEVCNLVETLPTRATAIEDWYDACEYATFYASTVALLPTHNAKTNAVIAKNRRIGVGIIDVTGWIHECGMNKVTKWLRKGYKIVRKINKSLAEEAGVPASIRVTTIKPGGTVPKLAGKTSGCGFPTFKYTLRRIRVQQNSPIDETLKKAGIPWEPDKVSLFTNVFEYPIIQGPAVTADKVSLWQQAMILMMLQREWADNSVSNTLYFKPKWELIERGRYSCVGCGHIYYIGDQLINECIKCGQLFNAIGLIERRVYDLIHEYHINSDYVNTSIKDGYNEYRNNDYKINVTMKEGNIVNYDFYKYNHNHEEDIIEIVLSMIAPLVKSVTMLPHTSKGAYVQMPEEGLTEEEYLQRLEQIKSIDWSYFRGDGMDSRYCEGPSCEIAQ